MKEKAIAALNEMGWLFVCRTGWVLALEEPISECRAPWTLPNRIPASVECATFQSKTLNKNEKIRRLPVYCILILFLSER